MKQYENQFTQNRPCDVGVKDVTSIKGTTSLSTSRSVMMKASSVVNIFKDYFSPDEGVDDTSDNTGQTSSPIGVSNNFSQSRMASSRLIRSNVRGRPSIAGLKLAIYVMLFFWAVCSSPTCNANMYISAFDYERKFHSLLELGDCPMREVGNTATGELLRSVERCPLKQTGNVTNTRLDINFSHNVAIKSPDQIFHHIGLCGGDAASYLGILYAGDCVAVDIANNLTFNSKTLVRAYITYYQESEDNLEPSKNTVAGKEMYYKDKFYLKSIYYGTLEIIIAHFRFENTNERAKAAAINLPHTHLMSDYMKEIQIVAKPTETIIISLSSSKFDTCHIRSFDLSDYKRAVRHVEINEENIRQRFKDINAKSFVPHLKYEFHPFLEEETTSLRSVHPFQWEKISVLEIKIQQVINQAKKLENFCNDAANKEKKDCVQLLKTLEPLKRYYDEFHNDRANWMSLTMEKKKAFTNYYKRHVKRNLKAVKRFIKTVRLMRKNSKTNAQNSTKHTSNEISKNVKERTKIHSHRHSRRRSEDFRRFQRE
ncbi:hypothetical protein Btru_061734 [Bulinus truncatus]|nr:hypothetical protein Btru_061734 [Bulinus truncatus]